MWTVENLLTYNRSFGRHTIGVLLGHSAISSRYYTTTASVQGFPTDTIYELSGASLTPRPKATRRHTPCRPSSAA